MSIMTPMKVAAVLAFRIGEAPITRGAEAAHLPRYGGTGLLFPRPHAFQKLFSTQIVSCSALHFELALDYDLCRDTGVVCTNHPVGSEATHAVITNQYIHERLLKRMAHVQRTGHIRRWKLNAIWRTCLVPVHFEVAARFPNRVPALLDCLRLEAFCEFHFQSKKSGRKL